MKKNITKSKGMTRAEYARHADVTRPRVTQWINLGMPVQSDGKIDPIAADKWRAENITSDPEVDEDFFQSRARKEKALADLREMEAAKASGELIQFSVVKSNLAEIFSMHRDGLLVIADRLAAPLATETDPSKVRELLSIEIRTYLNELADRLEGK